MIDIRSTAEENVLVSEHLNLTPIEQLTVIRKRLKMTTVEFGKFIGQNGGTLRAYENGSRVPSNRANIEMLKIVELYREKGPDGLRKLGKRASRRGKSA